MRTHCPHCKKSVYVKSELSKAPQYTDKDSRKTRTKKDILKAMRKKVNMAQIARELDLNDSVVRDHIDHLISGL